MNHTKPHDWAVRVDVDEMSSCLAGSGRWAPKSSTMTKSFGSTKDRLTRVTAYLTAIWKHPPQKLADHGGSAGKLTSVIKGDVWRKLMKTCNKHQHFQNAWAVPNSILAMSQSFCRHAGMGEALTGMLGDQDDPSPQKPNQPSKTPHSQGLLGGFLHLPTSSDWNLQTRLTDKDMSTSFECSNTSCCASSFGPKMIQLQGSTLRFSRTWDSFIHNKKESTQKAWYPLRFLGP